MAAPKIIQPSYVVKTKPVTFSQFCGFFTFHFALYFTGKVFHGTSCLVGMAGYANPSIFSPYFLFAALLAFMV